MFLSVLTDSNENFQNKTPPSLSCAGASPFLIFSSPHFLLLLFSASFVRAEMLPSGYLIRPCEGGGSIINIVDHVDLDVSI